MLLLQRPPSFPRSCWAAWTSWLKNTQETQNKTLYMSGCGQIVLLFSHGHTLTAQAVPEFDCILRVFICCRFFPETQRRKWTFRDTSSVVPRMCKMICWVVLFSVPGTTGAVKTALCAVGDSCNILYVMCKRIPDAQQWSFLHRRSAWAYFTFANGAQAKIFICTTEDCSGLFASCNL